MQPGPEHNTNSELLLFVKHPWEKTVKWLYEERSLVSNNHTTMRATTPQPRALYENVNKILLCHFSSVVILFCCRPRCCRHVLTHLPESQCKTTSTKLHASEVIATGSLCAALSPTGGMMRLKKCDARLHVQMWMFVINWMLMTCWFVYLQQP